MKNIENRLNALERAMDDTGDIVIIMAEDGECSEDARQREGISMNNPKQVVVICFD